MTRGLLRCQLIIFQFNDKLMTSISKTSTLNKSQLIKLDNRCYHHVHCGRHRWRNYGTRACGEENKAERGLWKSSVWSFIFFKSNRRPLIFWKNNFRMRHPSTRRILVFMSIHPPPIQGWSRLVKMTYISFLINSILSHINTLSLLSSWRPISMQVPVQALPASLHQSGATRVIPFDLSKQM